MLVKGLRIWNVPQVTRQQLKKCSHQRLFSCSSYSQNHNQTRFHIVTTRCRQCQDRSLSVLQLNRVNKPRSGRVPTCGFASFLCNSLPLECNQSPAVKKASWLVVKDRPWNTAPTQNWTLSWRVGTNNPTQARQNKSPPNSERTTCLQTSQTLEQTDAGDGDSGLSCCVPQLPSSQHLWVCSQH